TMSNLAFPIPKPATPLQQERLDIVIHSWVRGRDYGAASVAVSPVDGEAAGVVSSGCASFAQRKPIDGSTVSGGRSSRKVAVYSGGPAGSSWLKPPPRSTRVNPLAGPVGFCLGLAA